MTTFSGSAISFSTDESSVSEWSISISSSASMQGAEAPTAVEMTEADFWAVVALLQSRGVWPTTVNVPAGESAPAFLHQLDAVPITQPT